MSRIIGFAGPMGSGKTTAAFIISDMRVGARVLSFGVPVKKAAMEIFLLTPEQVYTMEGKQTVDPRWGMSPRDILQMVGTDAMRAVLPGVWVQNTKIRIQEARRADPYGCVVIDDVRFEDEAELIRDMGGYIVHLTGRRYGGATEKQETHASEKGIAWCNDDFIINNSWSLDAFRESVEGITGLILED
jgi:hypothetical protein